MSNDFLTLLTEIVENKSFNYCSHSGSAPDGLSPNVIARVDWIVLDQPYEGRMVRLFASNSWAILLVKCEDLLTVSLSRICRRVAFGLPFQISTSMATRQESCAIPQILLPSRPSLIFSMEFVYKSLRPCSYSIHNQSRAQNSAMDISTHVKMVVSEVLVPRLTAIYRFAW